MELALMMGLQGSGKSTFCWQHLGQTHVRISLDVVRTRRREEALVRACLEVGQRLVIDNTNPTRDDRARYIGRAKAARFRIVGYVFPTDLDACLARNARRAGKSRIPDAGVHAAARRWQEPIPGEGFDELHEVLINDSGGFIIRPRSD